MSGEQLVVELRRIARNEVGAEVERRETAGLAPMTLEDREMMARSILRRELKAQWQSEKGAIQGIRTSRAEVDALRGEVDLATRRGDLQRAAELRYGRIPELERKIAEDEARLAEVQASAKYLKEEVDADDIAEIVAREAELVTKPAVVKPLARTMETDG